jgi:hypothetical protein
MRYVSVVAALCSAALLCACATPPEAPYNPQNLNDTPDLSAFHTVELSPNAGGKREILEARYVADGAHLAVYNAVAGGPERLYVQAEECRNSNDADCPRRFILTGNLSAYGSTLKCYIQVRNDSNSGYTGQALQGLCQDKFSRSYSITISKTFR